MICKQQMLPAFFQSFLILVCAVQIEGITVSPSLCPTNKIAPHRRTPNNYASQRTFGAFYDLLTHDNVQDDKPSNLQEQPLADDPEDCGEIEDYDENDVGSATTESARRHSHSHSKYFFGNFLPFLRPPGHNFATSNLLAFHPFKSTTRPTRPPYASGGLFGGNPYRPPSHVYPSDRVKPVHEEAHELPLTYRPNIVGGPLGHIVGVTQVKPTNRPPESTSNLNSKYINSLRFSMLSSKASLNSNRSPRERVKNDANNGVLGSFIDLFFK